MHKKEAFENDSTKFLLQSKNKNKTLLSKPEIQEDSFGAKPCVFLYQRCPDYAGTKGSVLQVFPFLNAFTRNSRVCMSLLATKRHLG